METGTVGSIAGQLGTAQAHRTRQDTITLVAVLVALVLVGLEVWERFQGKPIHWINLGCVGDSQPGVITPEDAIKYAKTWLEARFSFTPTTLKTRAEYIRTTLHPRYSKDFEVLVEREGRFVKEYQLSSQVVVTDARIVKRQDNTFVIHLEGRRKVALGNEALPEGPFEADLGLVPWAGNSLRVFDVKTKPPLSLKGE